MANKYSKSNLTKEEKHTEIKEEHRKGYSRGARIVAIVLIGVMVVFTFVTAGIFLFD